MAATFSPKEITIRWNQLDIILPSQYGARRKQTPEEQLMIAILQDAIDCIEKYRFAIDPHGQRIFQEAKQWLLADQTEWPYSFECICGVLELDSTAVRQRLRVAAEQQTSARATQKYREDLGSRKIENRGQAVTDASSPGLTLPSQA